MAAGSIDAEQLEGLFVEGNLLNAMISLRTLIENAEFKRTASPSHRLNALDATSGVVFLSRNGITAYFLSFHCA